MVGVLTLMFVLHFDELLVALQTLGTLLHVLLETLCMTVLFLVALGEGGVAVVVIAAQESVHILPLFLVV